jgi:hypothetical protein
MDESTQNMESKKWLKEMLKAVDWPASFLKDDIKCLKKLGIVRMKTLTLLAHDDWRQLDIPEGIKLLIEIRLKENNIENTLGNMTIEVSVKEKTTTDRIRVELASGQEYEVDRYCPHKGADLSKVGFFLN